MTAMTCPGYGQPAGRWGDTPQLPPQGCYSAHDTRQAADALAAAAYHLSIATGDVLGTVALPQPQDALRLLERLKVTTGRLGTIAEQLAYRMDALAAGHRYGHTTTCTSNQKLIARAVAEVADVLQAARRALGEAVRGYTDRCPPAGQTGPRSGEAADAAAG